MIVVDEERCVGCGRCVAFCPREALTTWASLIVDATKCTDCFGGILRFEKEVSLTDKELVLDPACTSWTRLCIINCPVEALMVKEE